jgi:hypothetical protein
MVPAAADRDGQDAGLSSEGDRYQQQHDPEITHRAFLLIS